MKEQVLVCPVCGGALLRTERQYTCPAGHSFDVAKEGYVNLLCTSKSADKMGDSKESAAARHAFLERGYYGCLKEALTPLLHGNVLDICCGEGYYDSVPADGALYGFDLSKTMVRLAAKRKNGGQYFVANLARMPVAEGSIDTALHLFAPFHDRAFARVLAPGGRLYFEVGIGQADAVLRIMRAQGFGDIQVVKDHNDIPRVVFGTLCGEVYSE